MNLIFHIFKGIPAQYSIHNVCNIGRKYGNIFFSSKNRSLIHNLSRIPRFV